MLLGGDERARSPSRVADVDDIVDVNKNGMVDTDGEMNGMFATGEVLEGYEGEDVGQRVMAGSL